MQIHLFITYIHRSRSYKFAFGSVSHRAAAGKIEFKHCVIGEREEVFDLRQFHHTKQHARIIQI